MNAIRSGNLTDIYGLRIRVAASAEGSQASFTHARSVSAIWFLKRETERQRTSALRSASVRQGLEATRSVRNSEKDILRDSAKKRINTLTRPP